MSKLAPIGILVKDGIVNDEGQNLGKIDEIVVDLETGRIAFGVLAFGGFPNRTKLFAVPMELMTFSSHDKKFIFDIEREVLEKAAGYDTLQRVLETADFSWLSEMYTYFSRSPEWEKRREEERQRDLTIAQERKTEIIESKATMST